MKTSRSKAQPRETNSKTIVLSWKENQELREQEQNSRCHTIKEFLLFS